MIDKHICPNCSKVNTCNFSCLDECRNKYDRYINEQAEKEEAMSMYENGQESG